MPLDYSGTFTEQEFQQAAATFRNDLVAIPMLAMGDTTRFMTVQTGVRYELILGTKNTNAKFRPAGKKDADELELDLNLRALKTYPGELTAEFDPNVAIQTLIGHLASQASGDELKSVPTAREVLALIAKQAGEDFVYVIWNGKRNPKGNTPYDICDGFDTITAHEIADGAISAANKNLIVLDEEITVDNIMDVVNRIVDGMDVKLRKQECFMFCSQRFADLYNRAYKKESAGIVYNDKYEQVYIEGTNKKLTLAPVEGKVDSEFIHICPKDNIVVGCDQETDLENVKVKEYNPRTLTFLMDIFLGCQFRSIDKSQLLVVQLAEAGSNQEGPEEVKEEVKEDDNAEQSND